MKVQVLRIHEILELTGYRSANSIRKLEAEEGFPPRRRIGANRIGWISTEVLEWLSNRPTVADAERETA